MGIQLGSDFDVIVNLALDSRLKKADLTERDAIASGVRYEGMIVYVDSEATHYALKGGITNSDWVEIGGETLAAENITYDNATSGLVATDAQAAIDELSDNIDNIDALPDQTGNEGRFLSTDGTVASWETVAQGGGAGLKNYFAPENADFEGGTTGDWFTSNAGTDPNKPYEETIGNVNLALGSPTGTGYNQEFTLLNESLQSVIYDVYKSVSNQDLAIKIFEGTIASPGAEVFSTVIPNASLPTDHSIAPATLNINSDIFRTGNFHINFKPTTSSMGTLTIRANNGPPRRFTGEIATFQTIPSTVITVDTETVNPIAGTTSLLIQKSAADGVDHYAATPLDPIDDTEDQGSILFGSVSGDATSAAYISGFYKIEAWDMTGTPAKLYIDGGDPEVLKSKYRIPVNIYTKSTTVNIELRFVAQTTSTVAFNIIADKFKLGPASVLQLKQGPVGEVIAFAGADIPPLFLDCDGSAVSRTQYGELFSIIGTAHGSGDGSTTFNLPNYKGRFLRGVADGSTLDPDRSSRSAMATGGNIGDNVGSVQGAQTASHTHILNSSSSSGGLAANDAPGNNALPLNTPNIYANSAPNYSLREGSISNTGGNETRPVNAYVRYFIRYSSGGNTMTTNELGLQRVQVSGAGNAGTALTGTVTNIDFAETSDPFNAWSGTAFTAPRKARFKINGFVHLSVAGPIAFRSFVNGSSNKYAAFLPVNSQFAPFNWEGVLNKGDTWSLRSDDSQTLGNSTFLHWIEISSQEDLTLIGAVRDGGGGGGAWGTIVGTLSDQTDLQTALDVASSTPYLQNPLDTSWKVYFEEFMQNSGDTIHGPLGLFGGKTGTGASIVRQNGTATTGNRVGIYKLVSGSSSGAYVYMGNGLGSHYPGGNGSLCVGYNIKITTVPDATDDFISYFGFSDLWSGLGSNMAGLLIDRTINATNWVAITRLNNVSTTTDTGVAISTDWVTLETYINEDTTSVGFYIDGVLVATHTTHVPLNKAMTFSLRQNHVAGAARDFWIDFCYSAFKPSVARGTGIVPFT